MVPEESIESDGELVITACSFQSRALVMSRQKTDSVKYSKINNKAIKNNKKLVELKSGFLDKPMSQVVIKHKWPHMNQNPQYNHQSSDLNFQQFVGGECRMIIKTEHVNELYGCLRIMSKIAYLYDQCKSWDRARSAHFAIISSIEEGEAGWNSSFGHYDLMCVPPLEQKSDQYEPQGNSSLGKNNSNHDYFLQRISKRGMFIDCPSQSMDMQYIQK